MNEVSMEKTKIKAVGRISRLFQKKSKVKSSITSSVSTLSISDPVLSKQPSFQSISSIQASISETAPRECSLDSKNLPALPIHQERDNVSVNTVETETSVSLKSNRQQLIEQQRAVLKDLESERLYYEHDNKRLEEQLGQMQEKIKKRTEDMKALENSFQQHLKSVRCSDDDPQSIAQRLVNIRQEIRTLAHELLPSAEPKTTTEKLGTLWLNLGESIAKLGTPYLSPQRIQLLTEKFMMDVLVQNLNTNYFPGLSCHAEFLKVQDWFDQHDTSPLFATRLRQEISLLITSHKDQGEIETRWEKSAERHWHHLYRGLQKSYPKSCLLQEEKEYSQKLRTLVENFMNLGSAIKGQEVCITAMDVKEGVQSFDPAIMEDEDGQTEGVIALCISPPFVVKLSDHYEPLVKGRVLCFPFEHKPCK